MYSGEVSVQTLDEENDDSTSLVLNANGYPEGAGEDGSLSVKGDNWNYDGQTQTLTLLDGEFDLGTTPIAYTVIVGSDNSSLNAVLTNANLTGELTVTKYGTISGGTYTCTKAVSRGVIAGGVFDTANLDAYTITGGTFGQHFTMHEEPLGGIFLYAMPDALEITLDNTEDYTVNGLSLTSDTISVITNSEVEQTLSVKCNNGQTTAWYSEFNTPFGTQSGYFRSGYQTSMPQLGVTSVSTVLNTLTIKATNIRYVTSATLRAEHRPYLDSSNLTVTVGGETIAYEGQTTLTYAPGKDFSQFSIKASGLTGTLKYSSSVTYRTGTAPYETIGKNDIGKPGDYILTINVLEGSDYVPSSLEYPFTIEKGTLSTDDLNKIFVVTDPKPNTEDGTIVYDGEGHPYTLAVPLDAPVTVLQTGYCKLNDEHTNYDPSTLTGAPVEPGDYIFIIAYQPSENYESQSTNMYFYGVNTETEVCEKYITIKKATLSADDVQFNESGRLELKDGANVPGFEGTDFTYEVFFVGEDGTEYTEETIANAPAGTYKIYGKVSSDRFETVTLPTNHTQEVELREISLNKLHPNEDTSTLTEEYEYDGTAHTMDFEYQYDSEEEPRIGKITMKFYKAGMDPETDEPVSVDKAPINAGKYFFVMEIEQNEYYKSFAFGGEEYTSFEITPHTPTADDFTYTAPEGLTTDAEDYQIIAALRNSLSNKLGIAPKDIGFLVSHDFASAGEHTFRLRIAADSVNGNYTAADELTNTDWTFTVNKAEYTVSAPNAALTDDDGNALTGKIEPGTKVHLALDRSSLSEDFEFLGWEFGEDSTKVEMDSYDLTSETDSWFIMPKGNVTLKLTTPVVDPDPIVPSEDDGVGTAVALVAGGAAVGGAAYLIGTQVYLTSVLPEGKAIPTNRQQLADLLWQQAGKPEPVSTVLFTDISDADSQKAARWCVEQGLLKDYGETFKPSDYTFRLQVIKAWNDLQAKLNNAQ